jgi:isopenicillin N synthase-like dioxygenase
MIGMPLADRPNLPNIPIIDFFPFVENDLSRQQAVAQQMYQACQQYGFMYLKNYGLCSERINQIFGQMQQFFDLPGEVKSQVMRSVETNCGYVPIAGERLNPGRPGDLKEAFNVGARSVWLPGQEVFRQRVSAFYQDTMHLAFLILKALALALQLPESFFIEKHGKNFFLRLLHYPPLPSSIAQQQIRAGEHTDYGSITLLFQDPIGGLEICTCQGDWIPAPYIPETVIVNIGDAMQRWTNDKLRSTPHRVVNPEGELSYRSRYSAALFCDPNPEVEISCLESCCSGDRPSRYSPIRYATYLQSKFAATY